MSPATGVILNATEDAEEREIRITRPQRRKLSNFEQISAYATNDEALIPIFKAALIRLMRKVVNCGSASRRVSSSIPGLTELSILSTAHAAHMVLISKYEITVSVAIIELLLYGDFQGCDMS